MAVSSQPLVMGIAGGTGSGKSTVAQKIAAGLPAGSAVIIEYDSYYKDHPELSIEERELLNYDHPDALDHMLLVRQLDMLRDGQSVDVPKYDFVNHSRRAESERIEPAPVIIVEGILAFLEPEVRRRFDVKIFVDTDADIRVFRRIRRDMENRGRAFQHIREQYYKTVRPMHLQFVEPSKRWADVIIPEGGNNHVALDLVIGKLLNVLDN